MLDNIESKLASLGAAKLAKILVELTQLDPRINKRIQLALAYNDPNLLAKKIKSQITAIRRRTSFIDWRGAQDFANELYLILDAINNELLPSAPKAAADLIEYFINSADKIFEIVDDSNGAIGDVFRLFLQSWGEAWERVADRNLKELAALVFKTSLVNDYGERDGLIAAMKNALGTEGLDHLEQLYIQNRSDYENEYQTINTPLQDIADAKGDPDRYIEIAKQVGILRANQVCDIASRLIKKWREDEAIEWLLSKPNNIKSKANPKLCNLDKINLTTEQDRYDLLLQAYDAGSYISEADQLRWCLFELTLDSSYFERLLKDKSSVSAKKYKAQALKYVKKQLIDRWRSAISFLQFLGEYSLINETILKNYNLANSHDYFLYRPLSKELASQGHYLSACLLRRKLVDGILAKAQSKYYKYAVSDLSLAHKYAEKVQDWNTFLTHEAYISELQQQHGRKVAFWEKVSDKLL